MNLLEKLSLKELVEIKLERLVQNVAQTDGEGNLYHQVIKEVEESLIRLTMEKVGNKQTKAAKILGINRNTLRKKLRDMEV